MRETTKQWVVYFMYRTRRFGSSLYSLYKTMGSVKHLFGMFYPVGLAVSLRTLYLRCPELNSETSVLTYIYYVFNNAFTWPYYKSVE